MQTSQKHFEMFIFNLFFLVTKDSLKIGLKSKCYYILIFYD